MKVKEIIEAGWQNQKDFFTQLQIRKKLNDYAQKNDITLLYGKVHREFDPVFVLSTGRCGTAFLTQLLKADKTYVAFHEPEPEFFFHTQVAFKEHNSNPEKIAAMFDVARYELIRNTFISGKKYIETNNRITFFAFQIAELYPNAKFIHLVRNPESFIKSGLGRNWYSGKSLYDEGRITSENFEYWNSLSQIEKIGWLWNETNQFAEDFKLKFPNRVLTVTAEDLFTKTETQQSVFKFICAEIPSESTLKKFNKKTNEGKKIDLNDIDFQKIKKCVSNSELKTKYGF
jgi:hypothetical protein